MLCLHPTAKPNKVNPAQNEEISKKSDFNIHLFPTQRSHGQRKMAKCDYGPKEGTIGRIKD